METIEIRRLSPDDWTALREARLAGLTEAPYAFASTLDRELGFDEAAWRGRLGSAAYFGAVPPGPVAPLLGLVAGFPEPAAGSAPGLRDNRADAPGGPLSRRREPAGWHLVSMWVSPQARGQGVAGRLVTALCDLARAQGAVEVALWVTEVNRRALAFYRRAGFAATGERQLVRPDELGHWEQRMVRELR